MLCTLVYNKLCLLTVVNCLVIFNKASSHIMTIHRHVLKSLIYKDAWSWRNKLKWTLGQLWMHPPLTIARGLEENSNLNRQEAPWSKAAIAICKPASRPSVAFFISYRSLVTFLFYNFGARNFYYRHCCCVKLRLAIATEVIACTNPLLLYRWRGFFS